VFGWALMSWPVGLGFGIAAFCAKIHHVFGEVYAKCEDVEEEEQDE
jgi:hypothetical protein